MYLNATGSALEAAFDSKRDQETPFCEVAVLKAEQRIIRITIDALTDNSLLARP